MYQFDSTYDQEVPHMYPQVTQTFSRLETLSFLLHLSMILSIYSHQLSSRPCHLERKSCSPVERIRGHGENLSVDSQGKLRFHHNTLWYDFFFSGIRKIVIKTERCFSVFMQNCFKICAKCKNTGWSKVTMLTWSLRRVSDNFINVGHETSWIIDEKAPNSLNLDFRWITFNFLLLVAFLSAAIPVKYHWWTVCARNRRKLDNSEGR